MSTDEGKTHYVGDGCQPVHDPRIDQAPTDARVVAEAYRRASTGTGPVSFEELHAEYLVEIDAKVRAEKEIERLTVELTHRVGWEERCLDAEAALATLRAARVEQNDEYLSLQQEVEDLTKLGQSYLGEASEEKVRAASAEAEVERLNQAMVERDTTIMLEGERIERLQDLIRTAHDNADYIASYLRRAGDWPVLVMKAEAIMALEALASHKA